MGSHTKKIGLGVIGLLAVAAGVWLTAGRRAPEAPDPSAHPPGLPQFSGIPNREAPTPAEPSPQASPEEQVRRVMDHWRTSILQRNPDGVLDCDNTFQSQPQTFIAALRVSAETDDDPRVRAFSTRMLGKLHDVSNRDFFAKLLRDPNEQVRGNAAWGLEQLGLARNDPHPTSRKPGVGKR